MFNIPSEFEMVYNGHTRYSADTRVSEQQQHICFIIQISLM
jgi:hypothetical protein